MKAERRSLTGCITRSTFPLTAFLIFLIFGLFILSYKNEVFSHGKYETDPAKEEDDMIETFILRKLNEGTSPPTGIPSNFSLDQNSSSSAPGGFLSNYSLDRNSCSFSAGCLSNNSLNRNSSFVHEHGIVSDGSVEEPSFPVLIVLLSFFRSGSSWIGELLAKTPGSFYVFEPLHILQYSKGYNKSLGLNENFLSPVKSSIVKSLLHCSITSEFSSHSKKWEAVYTSPKDCHKDCKEPLVIAKRCREAKYRIIKTVRLSLENAEEMLILPSLSKLKIVYLVRDPRGSVTSIDYMNHHFNWKLGVSSVCERLRSDVIMLSELQKRFSRQIYFLRYEDISISPFNESRKLWNFITGEGKGARIPEEWEKFLNFSMRPKKEKKKIKPYDISKKSTVEWQSWRKKITVPLYRLVKKYCGDILDMLGYREFHLTKDLRNLSIPVLKLVSSDLSGTSL